MSGVQEQFEIRFRLPDGSDIGPNKYSAATTVATLKESILAEWPKESANGPRTVNDVKLINAGKILENNRTLAECRSPICDLSGITTMHVVVRAPSLDQGTEKRESKNQNGNSCRCTIL
ncbi:Membrane-anchored ubiquitin-fold protein 1 [Apostasia shenzhenica]|uniref:Membrane-anchored ubiquitin-fold protein n=1 Tax=Apostasia shenzhenica TaxID=1088818 RepID=A0A2I0A2I8_9ASPA|nr:Membrane-anchored ubiquitin-fold protein 1 [Apostasia shenzhenica]